MEKIQQFAICESKNASNKGRVGRVVGTFVDPETGVEFTTLFFSKDTIRSYATKNVVIIKPSNLLKAMERDDKLIEEMIEELGSVYEKLVDSQKIIVSLISDNAELKKQMKKKDRLKDANESPEEKKITRKKKTPAKKTASAKKR